MVHVTNDKSETQRSKVLQEKTYVYLYIHRNTQEKQKTRKNSRRVSFLLLTKTLDKGKQPTALTIGHSGSQAAKSKPTIKDTFKRQLFCDY